MPRQINRSVIASHTLVNHLARLDSATVLDSRDLPAVRVRHDTVRKRDDGLGLAVIGEAAATRGGGGGCGVVEGDLAVAGGVLSAGAGGALLVGGGLEGRGEGGGGEGAEEEEGLEDGGHFVCCFVVLWYGIFRSILGRLERLRCT